MGRPVGPDRALRVSAIGRCLLGETPAREPRGMTDNGVLDISFMLQSEFDDKLIERVQRGIGAGGTIIQNR